MRILIASIRRTVALALFTAPFLLGCSSEETPQTTADFLTPAESMQRMVLPPGYRLELVASEPQIEEPVAIAWDGNGRMYVAEMRTYMLDLEGTGARERVSRISLLEDTDGDGRMDRHSIFVDNLLLPRVILPLDDRIIIGETDTFDLWSYRDTNGDGVADEKILVYEHREEFGEKPHKDVEHQYSGLIWALDNWIYASRGPRHRFTSGRWETERTFSDHNVDLQWGLTQDDMGHIYYSRNDFPPIRFFQQPPSYWDLIGEKENWTFKNWPQLAQDKAFETVWPISTAPDAKTGKQILRENGTLKVWTSASGQSIYRGHTLPTEVYGDLFISEPVGRFVRRAKVDRREGRIVLSNAYEEQEFLASTDLNFRPVNTATGPDGALYIVDMYRGVIQEASYQTEDLKRRIRDLNLDKNIGRGRIYRVVYGSPEPTPRPRMLEEKTIDLIRHLAHPNGWWRDTAQKLIVLRGDRSIVPDLERMARNEPSALGRVHALWALEGLEAAHLPDLLLEKYGDSHLGVRIAAIRISEAFLKKSGDPDPSVREQARKILAGLLQLAREPDQDMVLRQLVLSLAYSDSPDAQRAIEEIIRNNLTSEIIRLAALTALYPPDDSPLLSEIGKGEIFGEIKDDILRQETHSAWQEAIADLKGRPIPPMDERALALLPVGETVFGYSCSACHGPRGRGGADAPPLNDSKRVRGQKEALIRILLHGLSGPLDNGKDYGLMPGQPALDDEELAGVLTYIRVRILRENLGSPIYPDDVIPASPIYPDDVTDVRDLTTGTTKPWTLKELERFAPPRIEDRESWSLSASHNDSTVSNAVDGDRETRYDTGTAQEPGMELEVDLSRQYYVARIVLDAGESKEDYPRGYRIEFSVDRESWHLVAEGEVKLGGRRDHQITDILFEPAAARWIRITQTGEDPIKYWSIHELHVYGLRDG